MCVKNKSIGKRIKELRKYLKLTQREFAERIYSSYRSVQNWETGERFISENNLRLLVDECKVSPLWIKTGVGEMFISDADKNISDIYIPACDILKVPLTLQDSSLFAFVSDSDVLAPYVCNGDIVLWKKCEISQISEGAFVVVSDNQNLTVERLQANNTISDSEAENIKTKVIGLVFHIFALKTLSPRE